MTVTTITGHRPEKLGTIEQQGLLWKTLAYTYNLLDVTRVIQGMASGVDLNSARIAYKSNIPFVCSIPWKGHSPRLCDREDYKKALDYADKVIYIDNHLTYPGSWVYQTRNIWMVDHSELLIAIWDGSNGGTKNAVDYAIEQCKPIYRIHPITLEVGWLVG